MKKISILMYILSIAMLIVCCKKEKDNPFSPAGYWRGSAYIYHTAILNKTNGVSRLYMRFPGTDTANAEVKINGSYTTSANGFRAIYSSGNTDTVLIESYVATNSLISGLIVFATGEAVSFEFRKQP